MCIDGGLSAPHKKNIETYKSEIVHDSAESNKFSLTRSRRMKLRHKSIFTFANSDIQSNVYRNKAR